MAGGLFLLLPPPGRAMKQSPTIPGLRFFPHLALFAALSVAGCSGESPLQLLPLPEPNLEGLESTAKTRLDSQRSEVERLQGEMNRGPALAQAMGDLGKLYHAHELLDSATVCYRNAATIAPQEPSWPYLLGHVNRASGHLEEASNAFRRTLELEPSHVPARIQNADVLKDLGQGPEARRMLQAALAQDPSTALAHYRLGQLNLEEGKAEEAIRHLQEALRLQPAANIVYSSLATAVQAAGDSPQAETALARRGDTLVSLADSAMIEVQSLAVGPRADLERGSRAFAARRFSQAEAAFRRAVEAEPGNAVGHLNLGSALVQLGRGEEGMAEFQEALRLDPANPRAHFNLGTVLLASGREEESIATFRRALDLDPAYTSARLNLANALLKNQHSPEALEQFRRILLGQPGNASAHLGQAIALTLSRRDREAFESLEASLGFLPGDPSLTNALARLLAASPNAAVRDGERSLNLIRGLVATESNLEHIETLAMALAESGDFDAAQLWQKRAIEAVRQSPRRDLLAGLEANLIRYEGGQACREPWRPRVFGSGSAGGSKSSKK